MKNLLILTSHFPYDGGEQFIESEINFWKGSQFEKVYLLPAKKNSSIRVYPEEFILLDKNVLNTSFINKLWCLFIALFSSFFWKEIYYIFFVKKVKFIISFYDALVLSGNVIRNKKAIANSIKNIQGDIFIYTYWNDVQFYASCLLKKNGKISKIVSRAHGGDLYEERKRNNYMPLKRQFVNDVDKVYVLSDIALEYYLKKYNFVRGKLEVARLGVDVCCEIKHKSEFEGQKIKILSLSYCVRVKRIDKIIKAINVFANKNENLIIEWTHIGGGPLFNILRSLACETFKENKNIKFNFVGGISNIEVKKILKNNEFDVFLNTSESEGIPVSIMEAMGCGIPAIAPTIGGIPDLVNKENGWLMSDKVRVEEVVEALESLKKCIDNNEIVIYRKNSKKWVDKHFNAEKNYKNFVKNIEILASE